MGNNVLNGRFALYSVGEWWPRAFSHHWETLVWQLGDRWGCLSCFFASSVISHSCSHLVQDGTLWNESIGLITSQGNLGAYLTCLSRDKRFYSKSPSYRTHDPYPPALGLLSFHLCYGALFLCTWRANDIGRPDNNNAIKFAQLGEHVLHELSVTLLINNTWYELILRKIMSRHYHLCYY